MKLDTGLFLVEFGDGTEAKCCFTNDGASLMFLDTWVDIDGPFDYGDTKAVAEAMDEHMAMIDRELEKASANFQLH